MIDDDAVQRALVVAAHPDDVDFGCAGTVARWTDRGIAVSYCVVTDGDAGGFDEAVPREEVPAIRRAEQRAAAAEVGVSDVRFLGYPDGRLEVTLELRRDIARVIRQVRPQRVVVHSPLWSFESIHRSHPDHRAAGEAAMCAVYPDARNPFAFTELLADEGLEPWSVPEAWIMVDDAGGDPHAEDVTDTVDRKLAAIRAHASQISDPAAIEARIRASLAENADRHGFPAGRLAETFGVVPTV